MENVQHSTERSSVTVLAIDDDEHDLEILRQFLKRIPGLSVEFYAHTDPEQGIQVLRDRAVDVLLLDYELGSRKGTELFEEIRAGGFDVPGVLMTNRGDEQLAVASLHCGFSDYIPKNVLSSSSLRRVLTNTIERHDLNRSIAKYQRQLEETVRDLESRNSEIQGFYHCLAHELKTPLTAIREFVSIVLDELQGPVNDDQRDSLTTAKKACDHMVTNIHDLLDCSRMDTGKLSIKCSSQSLSGVVTTAVGLFTAQAKEKSIKLTVDGETPTANADIDEERLVQVFSNLINNALKFTEPGGVVSVATVLLGQELAISVEDNGRGIEEADIPHIFDRLYQTAAEDSAVSGGLGLGLSLCRELVRLHDGAISVSSNPGKGSRFVVTLPLSKNQTPTF